MVCCAVVGYLAGCFFGSLPALGLMGSALIHAPVGIVDGVRYRTAPCVGAIILVSLAYAALLLRATRRNTEESWCWSMLFISSALAAVGSFAFINEELGMM